MPKFLNPRTWLSGEKPPATTLNDHIRDQFLALNGFVKKTADESVTSSVTLQDDNELTFTIDEAGDYEYKFVLFVTSATDAAGDLKCAIAGPTGTLDVGATGLDTTLAAGNTGTINMFATTSGASFNIGCSTTRTKVVIEGLLQASATGTLKLQWAQQTSHASATTVKAGSYMSVRGVG